MAVCSNFCEASDARHLDEAPFADGAQNQEIQILSEVQSLLSTVLQDQVMNINKLDLVDYSKEKIAALGGGLLYQWAIRYIRFHRAQIPAEWIFVYQIKMSVKTVSHHSDAIFILRII